MPEIGFRVLLVLVDCPGGWMGKGTIEHLRRGSVLLCAPTPPEFDRESGSRRINDFLGFFLEDGWKVRFLCQSTDLKSHYLERLRKRGVRIWAGLVPENVRQAAAPEPDLVVMFFWHLAEQLLPMIRRSCPMARILVDSVDLHFLRMSRKAFRCQGGGQGLLDPEICFTMVRELNAYAIADHVSAVSEKEKSLVEDLTGDPGLASFVPDCDELAASPIPYSKRKGILFVGNFRHEPNVDAVEYLCREIIPLLDPRILNRHPVRIVGNALDQRVAGLAEGLPNVEMIGWVSELEPLFHEACISILPLRFGAGTKRKLIQSLMCRTPAVSTSIGAEGLKLEGERHLVVADSAPAFAASVTRLLQDSRLWHRLARQGRTRILRDHSREAARVKWRRAICTTLQSPAKPLQVAERAAALKKHWLKPMYEQLVERIRLAVRTRIPEHSSVLFVSKGDNRIVTIQGYRSCHFPCDADGAYPGYPPTDSSEAVALLERLRGQGFDFFVLPACFFWWFDYYREFCDHLIARYGVAFKKEDTGWIFDLGQASPDPSKKLHSELDS